MAETAPDPQIQQTKHRALSDLVKIAKQSRDHAGLLSAATQLNDIAPGRPDGKLALAMALRRLSRAAEAEQLIGSALTTFPANERLWREGVTVALAIGNSDLALARCAEMRVRFRSSLVGYLRALDILEETSRMDQAPPILAAGLEALPESRELLTRAARVADRVPDIKSADRHWQKLVGLYPDDADIALSAALALYGQFHGRAKRWPEMLRRLDRVRQRFPDHTPSLVASVDAWRETAQLDEAQRMADGWCERFPDDVQLALARSRVAEDQGRFADAAAQIGEIRARLPRGAQLESAYARALSADGRHEEAETVCAAALIEYPRKFKLLCEYARLASRRGDWTEAYARWQAAQKLLPKDAGIAREVQTARAQLVDDLPADDVGVPGEGATVFARFESLGGSFLGCELGMIQRNFGADTLGLLRWTMIKPDALVDALEHEFEGVGSEERTVLRTTRKTLDHEEYLTEDKRFGMTSHTFVKTSDAPFDRMYQQTCRRLRFLRGKMLEDLQAADKIFVYKAIDTLDDAIIRRIQTALHRYGDVALLCVMKGDAKHKPGTVRVLARGLFVGYVGYFMSDSANPGCDVPSWKAICTDVAASWSAATEHGLTEAA